MAINTQLLASMSPTQAAQYVKQNLGQLPKPRQVEVPNTGEGAPHVIWMVGNYPAEQQPDGTFKIQATDKYDEASPGGQYGAVFANVDADGNVVNAARQQIQRGQTTFYDIIAPYIPAIIAGGAGLYNGAMSGAGTTDFVGSDWAAGAPTTNGAAGIGSGAGSGMLTSDVPMADYQAANTATNAPITQSTPTSLGNGATIQDIAKYLSEGGNIGNILPQIANVAKQGAGAWNALKTLLPSGAGAVIDGLLSNGTLSGLLSVGAGISDIEGIRRASNTAADAYDNLAGGLLSGYQGIGNNTQGQYNTLAGNIDQRTQGIGNNLQGQWNNLGATGRGMFNELGAAGQRGYNELGTAVAGTYNGLASQYNQGFQDLASKAESSVGRFRPYNITTNIGGTNDQGQFSLNPGSAAVSNNATSAAASSFGAANNIDVNDLTNQRYGMMQQTFAPGDAAALAELRSNEQATGRTNIQSLNPAYSSGGVGSNPREVAFYKAIQDRNLKAQQAAADQALAQRGGLITQGAQASGVPLNYSTAGTNMFGTGVQAGSAAMSGNLNATQLSTGLAARGLDTGSQIATRGADTVTGLFRGGLDYNLGQQDKGVQTYLGNAGNGISALTNQLNTGTEAASRFGQAGIEAVRQGGNAGLDAQTRFKAESIAQRYRGNLAATNALSSMLRAMSGNTAAGTGQSASSIIGQLLNIFKGQGMTDAQAEAAIMNTVQSQTVSSDPFTSNNYQDNVDAVNSIWS